MMQMLLETNLRELLVGFGHNLDNGSITISFGMLFMADLMTALIYCGKNMRPMQINIILAEENLSGCYQ